MDLLRFLGEDALGEPGGDAAEQRRPEEEAGQELADDRGEAEPGRQHAERPGHDEEQRELHQEQQQLVFAERLDDGQRVSFPLGLAEVIHRATKPASAPADVVEVGACAWTG